MPGGSTSPGILNRPAQQTTGSFDMQSMKASRMKQADVARNCWVVVPEVGFTMEELLDPTYWAHVAARLRRYDRIEVQSEDCRMWAELIVVAAGPVWAKVAPIRFLELGNDAAEIDSAEYEGLYIVHRGSVDQWCVLRGEDRQVLLRGHQSKGDAVRAAVEYRQKVAA